MAYVVDFGNNNLLYLIEIIIGGLNCEEFRREYEYENFKKTKFTNASTRIY